MATSSVKKRKKKASVRTGRAKRSRQPPGRAASAAVAARQDDEECSVSRPDESADRSNRRSRSPATADRSDGIAAQPPAPDAPGSTDGGPRWEAATEADTGRESVAVGFEAGERPISESERADSSALEGPPAPPWHAASDAAQFGSEPAVGPEDDEAISDTRAYLKGLLEALLFASDRPLTCRSR